MLDLPFLEPSRKRLLAARYRELARQIALVQAPYLFESPMDSQVSRERAVGFFPRHHHVWSAPEEFVRSSNIGKGIHTIWYGGLPIDLALTRSRQDTLLVIFHGALSPEANLPIFTGAQLVSGLPVARLSISDPSLYLSPKLNLAWFAGNRFQPDIQRVISILIQKVADSVRANRVILFGSSGGGFASLIQASLLTGSTAVVANAQTNLLHYHRDHVEKYLEIGWGADRQSFLHNAESSAVSALSKLKELPEIYYLQNLTDDFHTGEHLAPFLRAFPMNPHLHLLMGSWGQGHVAPPRQLFHETLSAVIRSDSGFLADLGFEKAPSYNDS